MIRLVPRYEGGGFRLTCLGAMQWGRAAIPRTGSGLDWMAAIGQVFRRDIHHDPERPRYGRILQRSLSWVLFTTPVNRGVWLKLHSRASPPSSCRAARPSRPSHTTSPLSMPPKKKIKIPSRAAPTDAGSPLPELVTFDGWTDEQETTLFKAISVYRLKPAGKLHQAAVPNQ